MSPRTSRPAALLLVPLALGCASAREVRLELRRPPGLAAAAAPRALIVGAIEVPRLHDLDVGDEVRRYLESEVRARTPIGVRLAALGSAPPAGAQAGESVLELFGSGTYEETTIANLARDRSDEEAPPGSVAPAPIRSQERWVRGYRLRLRLAIRKAGATEPLWSESFDREEPPRERGSRLFALYELLDPVGDAVVGALAGGRAEETRHLLPMGAAR